MDRSNSVSNLYRGRATGFSARTLPRDSLSSVNSRGADPTDDRANPTRTSPDRGLAVVRVELGACVSRVERVCVSGRLEREDSGAPWDEARTHSGSIRRERGDGGKAVGLFGVACARSDALSRVRERARLLALPLSRALLHTRTHAGKTSYWDERYTKDPEPFDWWLARRRAVCGSANIWERAACQDARPIRTMARTTTSPSLVAFPKRMFLLMEFPGA